ncbi:hypothetical protein ETAA8_59540 [Anatilimnocola aggregata]|uniref:Uncharacterized protein n=1 Tax=Anatilimnocola aggregata TaxID=2528021 RepID=A0A517YKP4_9BACT|nr:hypothetical protein [Anatilimnocola aggregata]QDU30805.1 hypothetical protein ETAA8_59540 [Anatilimnocola aggregata]
MNALLAFTLVHVVISLVAIAAGFVVIWGLLTNRPLPRWTAFFLTTTVLTSASGFGFPFEKFLPSHAFGILSLILLAVAIYALYAQQLAGSWRVAYVGTAIFAQYLNFFVLIVQAFLKVPVLKLLAPTQSELPFAAAQLIALVGFIAIGVLALRNFKHSAAPLAQQGTTAVSTSKSHV